MNSKTYSLIGERGLYVAAAIAVILGVALIAVALS